MPASSNERGRLLMQAGRHRLALDYLEASLAEDPGDAEAHQLLAHCCVALDQTGRALRHAREAVALAPHWCATHEALARVEEARGRTRRALAAIMEALRLHPEGVEHREVQSYLLGEMGHWRAALEAADAGLALDPEDVGCLIQRGQALGALGQPRDQLQAAEAVLAQAPEHAYGHAQRGMNLLAWGRIIEARDHLEQALRQDPGNTWAERALKEARRVEHPLLRPLATLRRLDRGSGWIVFCGLALVGVLDAANGSWKVLPVIAVALAAIWVCATAFSWGRTWIARLRYGSALRRASRRLPLDRRVVVSWGLVVYVALALSSGAMPQVPAELRWLPVLLLLVYVALRAGFVSWRRRKLRG